jgi:hypothetical protein
VPRGTVTNTIAPCTNPATYVDISHFPSFFYTDEEALSTYNTMGAKYRIQFKKYGYCKNEYGELTRFHLVCHKKAVSKHHKVHQGLDLKATSMVDCPYFV